jgi:hypothetical protein
VLEPAADTEQDAAAIVAFEFDYEAFRAHGHANPTRLRRRDQARWPGFLTCEAFGTVS